MFRNTFLLLLTFVSAALLAQSSRDDYFQQDVKYKIDATLDDVNHVLHADLRLLYTNNSPDTLTEIYFHLWPRAFSDKGTAFAKQQLRAGKTRFHFAEEGLGTLDSLSFTVGGTPADFAYDEVHTDIALLQLPSHLPPGQTITIETPFRVRIPDSWSRLGHVETSYQMTQWYPKPAVYDRDGWHAMPYLDQGEFYSEFGNFDVTLTLPENYVVGATGSLQTESERAWLLEKATVDQQSHLTSPDIPRRDFPASSSQMKTIRYVANKVHDFAWFADKRFYVLYDEMQVPGGDWIDVWSMFTDTERPLWTRSLEYLKASVAFYSEKVGPYPYPQVTAVQSALSAGGGMEYPMITVIGYSGSAESLDEVLAHEVGHNWFYGILGSNERTQPWMDEGLNSYYEKRYMAERYPDRKGAFSVPVVGTLNEDALGYLLAARQGKDQPPALDAEHMTYWNYWISAYSKPAMALFELQQIVGVEAIDRGMQAYYDTWRFRHPGPRDFFRIMDEATPDVPLNPWFPQTMLTTATSDWKKVDRDKGWNHRGDRLPPQPETIGETSPLDLYPQNNYGGRKTTLKFGIRQEKAGEKNLFWLPWAGYNVHDGLYAGGVLHNRTLEPRRFEWVLAPAFAFGSGEGVGYAGARYRAARPLPGTQQLLITADVRRFSDFTRLGVDSLGIEDNRYAYLRTSLGAELHLDHDPITEVESYFTLQHLYVGRERETFDGSPIPTGTTTNGNNFLRLGYVRSRGSVLRPGNLSVFLEYKDRNDARPEAFETSHLKLEATYAGGIQYDRGFFLRYRLFGGYFLDHGLRESGFRPVTTFSLVDNATTDYRYDDLYLGRETAGSQTWPGQQLERRQGGFRLPVPANTPFGYSNDYLGAANLDVDLPVELSAFRLSAFIDAGYYGFRPTSLSAPTGEFSWVAGAGLTFFDGQAGLYVPLLADPDTKLQAEQLGSIWQRLSFRLNLTKLAPWKLLDNAF